MAVISDTVVIGRTDNLWTTIPNATRVPAAAFLFTTSTSSSAGSPAPNSLVVVVSHKVGDIMATYSQLPDGCLSVVTTVYRRTEPDALPLASVPVGEIILRLNQVFAGAAS